MPHAHAFQQFMPDIPARRHKPFQRVLFFFGAAVYGDINQRRLSTRIQHNLADIGKTDAGIGQLSLDHGPDLLAQRLCHAVLMVFARPLFRHLQFPLIKRLRISDLAVLLHDGEWKAEKVLPEDVAGTESTLLQEKWMVRFPGPRCSASRVESSLLVQKVNFRSESRKSPARGRSWNREHLASGKMDGTIPRPALLRKPG